ncbi:CPK2 [Symbiodinium sp. KB8]|nr:CPK2 [Symbiodinium sp. KB8]
MKPKLSELLMLCLLFEGRAEGLDLGAAEKQLAPCAELLLERNGQSDELMACRVPLLGSLHNDQIPGYRYNVTEDCHFWASYAARDRHVEGSSILDFTRLAAFRLNSPFIPPLQQNGTALYIGAHRSGDDGLVFQRRHGLQMHLFEPSPTYFQMLRDSLAGAPGFILHNYGLGSKTRRALLRLSGTASRIVNMTQTGADLEEDLEDELDDEEGDPEGTETVWIRSAAEAIPEVLAEDRTGFVELLHVNCEGCEYDVVQGLSQTGQLFRVGQIQLATHLLEYTGPASDFQEALSLSLQISVKRYCEMHQTLSLTHDRPELRAELAKEALQPPAPRIFGRR